MRGYLVTLRILSIVALVLMGLSLLLVLATVVGSNFLVSAFNRGLVDPLGDYAGISALALRYAEGYFVPIGAFIWGFAAIFIIPAVYFAFLGILGLLYSGGKRRIGGYYIFTWVNVVLGGIIFLIALVLTALLTFDFFWPVLVATGCGFVLAIILVVVVHFIYREQRYRRWAEKQNMQSREQYR